MFLHLSGILFTGRGLCPGGVSLRGVSVQGGLCPGGSLSRRVSVRGVSVQGDGSLSGGSLSRRVFVQGVSVQGVFVQGVSVQGGLCQGDLHATGRIQCEVLTTLPFCFSWIKTFLGQQLKI